MQTNYHLLCRSYHVIVVYDRISKLSIDVPDFVNLGAIKVEIGRYHWQLTGDVKRVWCDLL